MPDDDTERSELIVKKNCRGFIPYFIGTVLDKSFRCLPFRSLACQSVVLTKDGRKRACRSVARRAKDGHSVFNTESSKKCTRSNLVH